MQMNVFTLICPAFSLLVIDCATQYLKIDKLSYQTQTKTKSITMCMVYTYV